MREYLSSLRLLYDKTPKRLLAVLVVLLVLYGCKRQILDPVLSAANTAIPAKNLDKAKNWFAKNKPNFHSANARINIDSVRYKEFFPVWQLAKMHTLIAGDTLIVVPVQRNFNISYTEIGFLRRLCLYIQHDSVKSAKIIELISDKATLKANEDLIFKNTETALNGGPIGNFNIAILQYDLAYKHEKGKFLANGTSKGDISLTMDNARSALIMEFTGENPWVDEHGGPRTLGGGAGNSNNGSGGGSTGSGNSSSSPSGVTCSPGYMAVDVGSPPNQVRMCVWINTAPSTIPLPPPPTPPLTPIPTTQIPTPIPGIPVPPPKSGGTPIFTTSGGGTTSSPPLTECMPIPVGTSGTGLGTMGVDPGTSTLPPCPGVDNGDNIELVVVPPPPLGVILDPSMETRANAEIKCIYDELIKQQAVRDILSIFGLGRFTLTIKVANINSWNVRGETSPTVVNGNVTITIDPRVMNGRSKDDSHLATARTIAHEMIHAYLTAKVADVGGMNATNSNLLNPSALPTLDTLMSKHKLKNSVVADLGRVDHEYMARYERDKIKAIIKAYDKNRSTDQMYDAVSWFGLTDTDRYRDEGYRDKDMNNNRKNNTDNLQNLRKPENPCNR